MKAQQTVFRLMGFVGQHVEICNTNLRTVMNEIQITVWKQQKKNNRAWVEGMGCIDN